MSPAGPDSPHESRGLRFLWFAAPAILLVVSFGLWLRLTVTGPTVVDEWWLGVVGLEPGSPAYRMAVLLAEVGGGTGAALATAALAGLLLLLGRIRAAGVLVTSMLVGVLGSELFKAFFVRLRPVEQLYDSTGYSYPSGHSMAAAAMATAVAIILARGTRAGEPETDLDALSPTDEPETPPAVDEAPAPLDGLAATPLRRGLHWSFLPALAWILLMMWSRTALQVHWLTDTVAGALLGVTAAILADGLWESARVRRRLHPPAAD